MSIKYSIENTSVQRTCPAGLYALQFVEGQLIGGRDAYDDEYEDSPYGGNYSAMAM